LNFWKGPGAKENTKFGPYYQSERRDLYKKYADKLVEVNFWTWRIFVNKKKNGDAYHCFCSADRLTELRESQMKKGEVTKYDGHCQKYTETEAYAKIRAGEKHVIRMRVYYFIWGLYWEVFLKGTKRSNRNQGCYSWKSEIFT